MILDKDRNPYRIYGNHREITNGRKKISQGLEKIRERVSGKNRNHRNRSGLVFSFLCFNYLVLFFFIRWSFFLLHGLTWLCWLCIIVFVSKGLVALVDGLLSLGLVIWWESPPGMIVLLLDHIWWGFLFDFLSGVCYNVV